VTPEVALAAELVALADRLLRGVATAEQVRALLRAQVLPPGAQAALPLDAGQEAPPAGRREAPWRPAVEAVFDYWRAATGHERAMLSPERVAKVRARLRDGFTVEQLCSAVNGCTSSEFHSKEGHDDLTLICRDASHVEKFMRIAEASGGSVRAVRTKSPSEIEGERIRCEISKARKEGRIDDYNRLVADLRAKGL
jgi:hypothetical protein